MYPPDLVALFQAEFKTNVSRRECETPPTELLGKILEVAFYSSMEREEGRPLKFRIGYCSSESLAKLAIPGIGRHWLPFEQPKPYTVSDVRRLSPAVDYTRSFICVHGDPPRITGIFTATNDHLFLETLTKFAGFRLPDIFNVSVADAGELDMNVGASPLVQFRQGQLRVPQKFYAVGTRLWDVEDQLRTEAVLTLPEAAHKRFRDARMLTPYPGFLARILFIMERRRHGGSLLIVPHAEAASIKVSGFLRIKYPFLNKTPSVWSMCCHWCAENRLAFYEDWEKGLRESNIRTSENPEYPQRLFDTIMQYADFTAGLSGVDGAVVITERLEVLGFGAEITSHTDDVSRVTMHDEREGTGETQNVEDNGMRHRSVYRFCNQVRGAIGIIVSQDGGIKVVRSEGNEVHVWRNIIPSIM